jgi:hypothetical protein
MKKALVLLLCIFGVYWTWGQPGYWTLSPERTPAESTIQPAEYTGFFLDRPVLEDLLGSAPEESQRERALRLRLPHPSGQEVTALLWRVPVLSPRLSARYPGIRTYAGHLAGDPAASVRLDLTPRGFHVMVLAPGGSWFIDPVEPSPDALHMAYFKRHLPLPDPEHFRCAVEGKPITAPSARGPLPIGDELRVYRLAVSATGEYTQYHGGTVQGALAAIATTMNRVNGVYERDVAVRMILVDNNDQIIFTDPATDPFTTNEINQNQGVVDNRIGSENYDIGHVFDRGGGGVASLRSVCTSDRKARGYTSLQIPEGDPFDIDYVAHEIGHQFGANHTQNNPCNRVPDAAFEPGSASTIMGYAGICPPNLQNNSDDHFHVHSIQEMIEFSVLGFGNSCPQIQSTGNSAPQVEPGLSGLTVPIETPFELLGSATDAEGDSLTYCWEQYDLGPAGPPNSPIGNAPIFRSFKPTPDSFRVFPRMQSLLTGISTIGELLPNYSRDLTFRLTVRDNRGGLDWEEVFFQASDAAGPFTVTSQASPTDWQGGHFAYVRWDIADTDEAPIAADSVSIFLSLDGGFTFPLRLVEKTPNDGSHLIRIPETAEGRPARVKVKGYQHVFFNINEAEITLSPSAEAGFAAAVDTTAVTRVCGQDEATLPVYFSTFGGFSETVAFDVEGLPDEVTAVPQPMSANSSDTILLSLAGLQRIQQDQLTFEVVCSSADTAIVLPIRLEIFEPVGDPSLLSPADGAIEVSTLTQLAWEPADNAVSYRLVLAENPDLEDPVLELEGVDGTSLDLQGRLQPGRTYYWQVAGENPACGAGQPASGSFTTESHICRRFDAEDVPLLFSADTDQIASTVDVETDSLLVRDVNLLGLEGFYIPSLDELNFLLRGPDSTEVQLLRPECQQAGVFSFSLDEEARLLGSACPLDDEQVLRPEESLHVFDGQNAQGSWTLIIQDDGQAGGLRAWTLEICVADRISSTAELDPPAESSFSVFPNPVHSELQLRVQLQEEARLYFGLLDALGREVRRLELGHWAAGLHQWTLDVSGLPPGMY